MILLTVLAGDVLCLKYQKIQTRDIPIHGHCSLNNLKTVQDYYCAILNQFPSVVFQKNQYRFLHILYEQMNIQFPVVIRLAGTNLEEGKHILAESGISFIEAKDFYDGAYKVVQAAKNLGK